MARRSGSRSATNISGVYAVDWMSVSVVDGHLITGSFSFDVGVTGPGSSASLGERRARAAAV